jgi:lipid II:glycine glycyltransferase (peptidoglycan interpeptide bridge formation enzyme)
VVADRRGIGFFPADYFIKQAELLMPAGIMHLQLTYDGKQAVGGAIIHDYGPLSCYTFAASLPEAQKKSVAALTLWQVILNAKQRGQKTIDLYGSAPDDAPPSHPWYGLSINKRKFGGELVETVGTWDVPLSNKYWLYRWAQKSQKIKRRISRR